MRLVGNDVRLNPMPHGLPHQHHTFAVSHNANPYDEPPPSKLHLIPIPDRTITLSASLAVRQHCLRLRVASSLVLDME